jgi:hypothetical protein
MTLEEAAESRAAQAYGGGYLAEAQRLVCFGQKPGGSFDGRVQRLGHSPRRGREGMPGTQEKETKACIERLVLVPGIGEFGAESVEPQSALGAELPTEPAGRLELSQQLRPSVAARSPYQPSFEDADQHVEIGGHPDQYVLLAGKEPDHRIVLQIVSAIANEVAGCSAHDEVEFQFGMPVSDQMVPRPAQPPKRSVEPASNRQSLPHATKYDNCWPENEKISFERRRKMIMTYAYIDFATQSPMV